MILPVNNASFYVNSYIDVFLDGHIFFFTFLNILNTPHSPTPTPSLSLLFYNNLVSKHSAYLHRNSTIPRSEIWVSLWKICSLVCHFFLEIHNLVENPVDWIHFPVKWKSTDQNSKCKIKYNVLPFTNCKKLVTFVKSKLNYYF